MRVWKHGRLDAQVDQCSDDPEDVVKVELHCGAEDVRVNSMRVSIQLKEGASSPSRRERRKRSTSRAQRKGVILLVPVPSRRIRM